MKKLGNDQGQALIELIIFLPLMLTLYSVVSGYAGSINGSINQQKITRAYFYSRVMNNSNFPGPGVNTDNQIQSWKSFGMFFIGWKDYFLPGSQNPVMACYKVNIPFKNTPAEKCHEPYANPNTMYVRIGTVYGACGATWVNINRKTYPALDNAQADKELVLNRNGCIIR